MGIRVARAAGKRQGKQAGKKRSAARSRVAKPRANKSSKRGTAKPRASAPKSAPRRKRATKPTHAVATRKTAVAKQPVRKQTPRTPATRPAAAAPRKSVRKAVAPRQPERKVVAPRHRPTPVPPAFAVQRASASSREQLLFELARARTSVKAAIQGLTTGSAMRPVAPGKWSPFEIVLHLSERDRVRLEEFARALAGRERSWAGIEDPEMGAVNEAHLAPLRAHTWDEAVRRLDSLREELTLRLNDVPEQPDDVWQHGHAFGDMMWGLPEHDRHHAEQLKRARMRGTTRAEGLDV